MFSRRNRLLVHQCSRSRHTCPLTSHSVLIPISVRLPLVKPSHNAASITGRPLSRIHSSRVHWRIRSSWLLVSVRVFHKSCHHSIATWTNCKSGRITKPHEVAAHLHPTTAYSRITKPHEVAAHLHPT